MPSRIPTPVAPTGATDDDRPLFVWLRELPNTALSYELRIFEEPTVP